MKIKIDSYTFDKTAKTVTFTDYVTIYLDSILLITNVTDNIIIYNFADAAKGGTVLTNVITLEHDTSSMDSSDKLLIYYDDSTIQAARSDKQLADGHNVAVTNHPTEYPLPASQINSLTPAATIDSTVLFTGNVNATGAGTSINTTGYASIVAQFSGIWAGVVHCEVSNDNTNWEKIMFYSSDEVSMQDMVDQNGIFSIIVSAKYVRPFVVQLTGTIGITIIGRTVASARPIDMLSLALDKATGVTLQVQLPKDLKQEPDGSLLLADMKGPFVWNSATATQPFYLDCTGYQSILVHKITTGVVTPYVSNDGKTWSATVAVATATGTPAATILTAAGMYVLPVVSKMIQLVGPASVIQCFIYLSQTAQPLPQGTLQALANNITQLAGSAIVTGGLAGVLSVGGNVATGVAPTANPVQIGGVDALKIPLTRRILVDEVGRLQIGNTPSQLQKGVNTLGFDPLFRNVLEAQDTTKIEGQSQGEILLQILTELKILNIQIQQLPYLLDRGLESQDEVNDYRNDQTLFNQ